jgi:hypothetical protein
MKLPALLIVSQNSSHDAPHVILSSASLMALSVMAGKLQQAGRQV